jgi:uncharacterized membrane protein
VGAIVETRYSNAIHPLHAILLAGAVPLFLGATLSDVAYFNSYEIQWSNFASWLIVGALVFSGIALVFAIVDLFRAHRRANGIFLYFVALLAAWIVGFFNALMHARDAWAVMPSGLVLSVIATLLACIAAWFGFGTPRVGGAK